MPKRNRKFKNPFHKPKRVKIDTTVVIPSDQDETEIDEVIRIESSEEKDVDEPTVNRQPTPPVVLNLQPDLQSIENEEEFPNGINYRSTPLQSPMFSNPPRFITIGK